MSSKNTYWIADSDGRKALVESAEERDRWIRLHGWAEADEPTGLEFVWVHNENPELLPAPMNWQAATDPAWAARGWAPGPPVEPVNNAIPPERRAAEQAAAAKVLKDFSAQKAAAKVDDESASKTTEKTSK